MKLDSIFKGLGVETMEDITKLSSFFVIKDETRYGENGELEEKLIHPNDAIRAIRRFVEAHRNDKLIAQGKANMVENKVGDDRDRLEEDEDEEIQNSEATQKIKAAGKSKSELQRDYWKRMADIIDSKSYRVWNVRY